MIFPADPPSPGNQNGASRAAAGPVLFGSGGGIRTPDKVVNSHLLYH